jgi:hypothetical protein
MKIPGTDNPFLELMAKMPDSDKFNEEIRLFK